MKNYLLLISFCVLALPNVKSQTQVPASSTKSTDGYDWTLQSGSAVCSPSKILLNGDGSIGGSILIQSDYGQGGAGNITLNTNFGSCTSGGNIFFNTNNATKMTMLSNGNFGIGVTPTQKLDVAGNIKASGTVTGTNINSNGSIFSGGSSLTWTNTGSSGYICDILLSGIGGTWKFASFDYTAGIKFDSRSSSGYVFNQSNAIQMSIKNGKVGIGIADPQANLHIVGNQLIHMATDVNLKIYNGTLAGSNTVTLNTNNDAASVHTPLAFSASKFYFESGNVGIGCSNPTSLLTVNGKILAKEIELVDPVPSCDYVFEPDYKLMDISKLEQFVKTNKRLPEIKSAKAFKDNGYDIAQMDNDLLKKVEELTLYLIEQNNKITQLEQEIENLKASK